MIDNGPWIYGKIYPYVHIVNEFRPNNTAYSLKPYKIFGAIYQNNLRESSDLDLKFNVLENYR